MAKAEFLMLVHNYDKKKHQIAGAFWSEKLDGMRCYWDGGISRGVAKRYVPWANLDKDGRLIREQICTGLWSRYGNIIHAPDWWLDQLPYMPLDGELWIQRGMQYRQELMSTIKKHIPGPGWDRVKYMVFDTPSYDAVFSGRVIKNANFKKKIDKDQCMVFLYKHEMNGLIKPHADSQFQTTIARIKKYCKGPVAVAIRQQQLPFQTDQAEEYIEIILTDLTDVGAEGIVVRKASSFWVPERSHDIVRLKKAQDDEGVVMGYITGRETDKGSKLLGMMGSMLIYFNGKIFELSGFTENERELQVSRSWHNGTSEVPTDSDTIQWAKNNPEKKCPEWIEARNFSRGTIITFRYRELSKDGIPIEARYWRKKENDQQKNIKYIRKSTEKN